MTVNSKRLTTNNVQSSFLSPIPDIRQSLFVLEGGGVIKIENLASALHASGQQQCPWVDYDVEVLGEHFVAVLGNLESNLGVLRYEAEGRVHEILETIGRRRQVTLFRRLLTVRAAGHPQLGVAFGGKGFCRSEECRVEAFHLQAVEDDHDGKEVRRLTQELEGRPQPIG